MRKFQLYKHENCTDLIIEPIRIIYLEKPKRIKVKANFYTCGYPGKLILMDKDEFTVLYSNNQWKLWNFG